MTENKQPDYQSLMAMFDPLKMAEQFKSFLDNAPIAGIDADNLLNTQKKTYEAFLSANQNAISGTQSLMERQSEMFWQAIEDTQKKMEELSEAEPSELAEKNAEALEQGVQNAMKNYMEIAEMMQSTYSEVAEKVEKQMQQNVQELQDILSKTS